MTAKERDILDKLRGEVYSYHSDVRGHISRCDSYFQKVDNHDTDLYGNPEDREGNPGVMLRLGGLEKSRKILLIVVGGIWTITTIFIGAAVSHYI